MRASGEVLEVQLVPDGSAALNPAFDVTPARLVTGLALAQEREQTAHVWVEACVPYSNYRGAGVDPTGQRWIPLDLTRQTPGGRLSGSAGHD